MALIIILTALVLQRLILTKFEKPRFEGLTAVYGWLDRRLNQTVWWHGSGGVALLLMSLVVSYAVLVALLTHVIGTLFTFVFGLAVLWYYLEAQSLKMESEDKVLLSECFMRRYHRLFALLFWFVLAGPLGVMIYAESGKLIRHFKLQKESDVYFDSTFCDRLVAFQHLMDWVPVRLLGLTYALVGQFRPAFTYWWSCLVAVETGSMLVVDYGMVALNKDPNLVMTGTVEEVNEIESLTMRSLIVWLAVVAMFTLGHWL